MTTSTPAGAHAAAELVGIDSLVGPRTPRRIGIVVPHDMALDGELWRWVPDGVTLHFTRQPNVSLPVTVEMVNLIGDPAAVAGCVSELTAIEPEVIAYGCTSGSFANGIAGEQAVVTAMEDAGAAKGITTSGAVLAAVRRVGAHRVSIATPYDDVITDLLEAYLNEADISVVGSARLGLHGGIADVEYAQTVSLIREADRSDADAIVVSCTNLPTYDLIAPLEAELGKPIITANQATVWAAVDALGRAAVGPGQALLTA